MTFYRERKRYSYHGIIIAVFSVPAGFNECKAMKKKTVPQRKINEYYNCKEKKKKNY